MLTFIGAVLRNLGRGATDLLWPPRCILCHSFLTCGVLPHLCRDCTATLEAIRPPCCPGCGLPLSDACKVVPLCGKCQAGAWHFSHGLSLFVYNQALAALVHRAKFGGDTAILASLAACGRAAASVFSTADLIVPVPLHPSRLRQRGFNQSLLLARALFPGRREAIRSDLLLRPAAGKAQRGLRQSERQRNMRGAFLVTKPAALEGKSVVIVDDVFTTGATIDECAKALTRAGAGIISFVTLARVLESRP